MTFTLWFTHLEQSAWFTHGGWKLQFTSPNSYDSLKTHRVSSFVEVCQNCPHWEDKRRFCFLDFNIDLSCPAWEHVLVSTPEAWLTLAFDKRMLHLWYAWVTNTNLSRDHLNMKTSSNGNIFRVTVPLCREYTGEFPSQRPVTRSFDVIFDQRFNKRLSKQSRCRWFETPSRSLWHYCNDMWQPNKSVRKGYPLPYAVNLTLLSNRPFISSLYTSRKM